MKIGIITMPLCANYGGTLQNWALQQVLKRMGHETLTLRFPVEYQDMTAAHYWTRVFPMQVARYIYNKLRGRKYTMPMTIRPWKRSVRGMERFVDEHINVTEYLPNLSMEDVRRHGVEALIVGSDQIWRPVKYSAEKYYFLGFAEDSDMLKVAYAPSVALDTWPYKEETTARLRQLAQKFDAVSVREESSVQLVKENLNVDAQWVLDPTMLLKKEDYLPLCAEVSESSEPFVFAYILDMTDEKRDMAEQTAQKLGCKVRYLTAERVKEEDTFEKWLANFRDARYIVTDSYHGTVFSLIFRKQFVSIYNTKRGNARMDSLKKITGLDDRFITEAQEIAIDEIDYSAMEVRIEEMRKKSLGFLESLESRV